MFECWFTKILVLLVVLVTVVTVLSSTSGESRAYQIAKEGCPNECGGVPIPFPFGIGDGCFITLNTTDSPDDAFRINCDNSTNPPVPYLGTGNTKFEVLSIDVEASTLRVPQGIAYECYRNGKQVAYNTFPYNISLSGMEMQLSLTNNEFVAVGCDTFAWESMWEPQPICNTSCIDSKAARNGTCDPLHGCCQASLAGHYVVNGLYVNGSSRKNEGCHYTFVSEIGWYNFSTLNLTTTVSDCEKIRVPVVYDWQVLSLYLTCGSYATNTSTYTCECWEGFTGNPYLPRGCDQDIYECYEESLNNCQKPSLCVKKKGGYDCRCPNGHHGNGTLTSPCIAVVHGMGNEVALQGCPTECGGVKISFPFGIGHGCFGYSMSEFEIKCDLNSTNPKPILPFLGNREVLSIDIENHTLRLSYEVAYHCFEDNHLLSSPTQKNITLDNLAPFKISTTINKFLAIGCDATAWLVNNFIDPWEGGVEEDDVIGASTCTTFCDHDIWLARTCESSSLCCEASIFGNLSKPLIYIDAENLNSKPNPDAKCMYAFVGDVGSYNLPFVTNLIPNDCGSIRVPILYDWHVSTFSEICSEAMKYQDYSYNMSGTMCRSNTRIECIDEDIYGYHCQCLEGYDGNPYIPQGCKDINECLEERLNDCKRPGFCVNQDGGYHCRCPDGHYGTGTIISPCIPYPVAGHNLILGLSISMGSMIGVILLSALYKLLKRRKEVKQREHNFKKNGGLLLQQQMSTNEGAIDRTKIFSRSELEKATNNFNNSRVLGSGGQGTVYKGMLVDGTIVAVKKSKMLNEQHLGQFINEVIILSQINHRNVVKLFGCCLETEVPLLVYEFIPNDTLHQHIHHPSEDFHMTWPMRFQIAMECAGAIAYLHSSCSSPIYHRDIKSSNILLDEKYRAKISDFGTSRSISIDKTHVTTCVQGTFAYLDPEFFRSSHFSEKSDVYSFGVVLLELLTSKKPIFTTDMSNEPRSLATTFVQLMETNPNELHNMVDDQVLQKCSKEEVEALANLIERCLSLSGKQRPTMREVAMTLEMIKVQHGIEGNPANDEAITEEGHVWNGEIGIINEDLSIDTSYNDNSYFVNSQPLSFDCN